MNKKSYTSGSFQEDHKHFRMTANILLRQLGTKARVISISQVDSFIYNKLHCEKYRNFTQLPGVEILWKSSFRIVSGENVPFHKISTPEN